MDAAFRQQWIVSLMDQMQAALTPAQCQHMLEACGSDCARRGALNAASRFKGDLPGFIATFQQWIGAENVTMQGNQVFVTYPECFCEMVKDLPGELPEAYCYCSAGWLKEIFTLVTQQPVQVEILQSVKRGAQSCCFIVSLF